MNKLTYGDGWFRWERRITEIWDAEKARKAHDKRKPYVALVEKPDGSQCVVEVNNDYFGIEFLDEARRSDVSLQFIEREPRRLFLSMAAMRAFEHSTNKVTHATTYHFKEDGKVFIEKQDFTVHERWTTETSTDASKNWVPYPEFGYYDELINIEL